MLERPSRPVRRTLALAASAAVAAALLAPLPPPDTLPSAWTPPQLDKLVHALLFGALAAIWWWAGDRSGAPRRGRRLVLALAGFGALLELLQNFSPDRSPDLWDAVANAVGAAGVALVAARRGYPARAPVDSR